MRASRSAGRRELALWLQREQAAGRHVPSALGAVDEDRSGYGDRAWSLPSRSLRLRQLISPLLEKGCVDKISSSIFKLKRGCVKNNYQWGTTRDQEVLNSDSETVFPEKYFRERLS